MECRWLCFHNSCVYSPRFFPYFSRSFHNLKKLYDWGRRSDITKRRLTNLLQSSGPCWTIHHFIIIGCSLFFPAANSHSSGALPALGPPNSERTCFICSVGKDFKVCNLRWTKRCWLRCHHRRKGWWYIPTKLWSIQCQRVRQIVGSEWKWGSSVKWDWALLF